MIYIIAGTEDEAEKYVKEKKITEATRYIPDSGYSMDCEENPTVIFVGSYKNRKDILDRLMESRDILLARIAYLEKLLVYDNNDNLITQIEYNKVALELEMYREYTK